MKIILADLAATRSLGQTIGESLAAGSTILLTGELGAGKTTLVQGIGEALEIQDAIVSPTFSIINEYPEGRIPLYHLDLYRLEPKEVTALNLETYWEGIEVTPGITAIEWSERMSYLPQNYLNVILSYESNGARQAELMTVGDVELVTGFLDQYL